MTDATQTPAPAADAGIADQQKPTSAEQQPQESPQEQTPQYVTKDDLAQFGKELANRLKQSDRDRTKRIEEEVGRLSEIVTKTGLQLTPQQVAAMREQIGEQLDTDPDLAPQPAGQINQPGGADPVAQFISDTFKAAGMEVTPSDPEWQDFKKTMDAQFNNPNGAPFVAAAAVTASKAKQARLASNQSSAAARVTSGAAAPAGNTILDPNAPALNYFKEAFKNK